MAESETRMHLSAARCSLLDASSGAIPARHFASATKACTPLTRERQALGALEETGKFHAFMLRSFPCHAVALRTTHCAGQFAVIDLEHSSQQNKTDALVLQVLGLLQLHIGRAT